MAEQMQRELVGKLKATMEKTKTRFANYGEAGLPCGADGAPSPADSTRQANASSTHPRTAARGMPPARSCVFGRRRRRRACATRRRRRRE